MNDQKVPKEKSDAENDRELSALLDSALDDFGKETASSSSESKETVKVKDESEPNDTEVEWSDEFIMRAAQQFENDLSPFLENAVGGSALTQEQIQQSFQKMAEAAQHVLANPGEIQDNSTDFASAITQTIKSLSEGAENLQNPFSEQDIINLISGADTEGGSGEQNGFLPFMQGMMQSLLSKDVLYPSLKDILDKYPTWLEEHSSTLTEEDKTRYGKQQKLMEDVCKILESETESDTQEVKKQRFEKVLGLMQQLQDYGHPPTDLVGDVGPGFQFDSQGNPEQCSII